MWVNERKRLTTILNNLERCDFVLSYSQFGNKSKGTIYRLVDFYTLFYLKFIESSDTKDEEWWLHNYNSRSVASWQGTTFELVCLTHLPQIRRKLGIDGISTSASSWRIVTKYNLANSYDERFGGDLSHVVVMQHVKKDVIDKFIAELESTMTAISATEANT